MVGFFEAGLTRPALFGTIPLLLTSTSLLFVAPLAAVAGVFGFVTPFNTNPDIVCVVAGRGDCCCEAAAIC